MRQRLSSLRKIEKVSESHGALIAWGLAGVFFLTVGPLKIVQHFFLQTQAYDLGVYANVLWNTLHGRPFFLSFAGVSYLGDHFAPALALLAPLLLVWENAAILLLIQTAALAIALPGAWGLVRRVTGRSWVGLLLAVWLGLSPSLHRVSRYDFHETALLLPCFLWALRWREEGRRHLFWFFALFALLWREDVGLLLAGLGVSGVFQGGVLRRREGLALVAAGVVWTCLAVFFFIPFFGHSWRAAAHSYSMLGDTPGAILSSLFNPSFLWKQTLAVPEKATALGSLLASTGGLVLFAPRWASAWLVPVGLNLLSGLPCQYRFELHYAAGTLPFLVYGMAEGWRALGEGFFKRWRWARPAAGGLTCGMILWGCLHLPAYFHRGPSDRRLALRELVNRIPKDDPVSAQTNLLPHLCFREKIQLAPSLNGARWVALDGSPVGFNPPEDYRRWAAEFMKQYSSRRVVERAGLVLFDGQATPGDTP